MSQILHSNYKKAAYLSAIAIGIDLFATLLNGFSPVDMTSIMIGILIGVIVTLLISLGYNWMKWIMLLLSVFGTINIISNADAWIVPRLLLSLKALSLIIDITITYLIFKAE